MPVLFIGAAIVLGGCGTTPGQATRTFTRHDPIGEFTQTSETVEANDLIPDRSFDALAVLHRPDQDPQKTAYHLKRDAERLQLELKGVRRVTLILREDGWAIKQERNELDGLVVKYEPALLILPRAMKPSDDGADHELIRSEADVTIEDASTGAPRHQGAVRTTVRLLGRLAPSEARKLLDAPSSGDAHPDVVVVEQRRTLELGGPVARVRVQTAYTPERGPLFEQIWEKASLFGMTIRDEYHAVQIHPDQDPPPEAQP